VDFGKQIWEDKDRSPKGQGWRPEGLREETGFLGGGQQAVSSPSSVRGRALANKRFSRILNNQNDLSGQQDYGPLAKHIKHKK